MKKLLLIITLLALAGCQQPGSLTWTPTQAEWGAMTPEQRNEWYRLEMEAREHNSRMWQQSIDNLREAGRQGTEQDPQKIIIVPQNHIDLTR